VRLPRLLLLTALAVLSLAVTTAATAMRGPVEDGTLSVRDARATIVLRMKGGIIGRLARGKITITDSLSDSGSVIIRGEEHSRDINDRTTVYWGTNIRFRITDEKRFVARIEGTKINFSAVGRGDGWLDGRGDQPGVFFDGSYSLNGEDYKSLPDRREPFELAASPPASG
jgi:hypothetical protein